MTTTFRKHLTLLLLVIALASVYSQTSVKPFHVRLSLSSTPNTWIITWETSSPYSGKPIVQLLQDSSKLQIEGVSKSFGDITKKEEWKQYGHLHYVLVNVSPNTKYLYNVGGKDADGTLVWSEQLSFTTTAALQQQQIHKDEKVQVSKKPANDNKQSAATSTLSAPMKFLWVGDMGVEPHSFKTMKDMYENEIQKSSMPTDLLFHIGDIAYCDMNHVKDCNVTTYDRFMTQIEFVSRAVPYMVCIGNHDTFYESQLYGQGWNMPYPSLTDKIEHFYYSFNYGNAHFISLDTEHAYFPFSPQHVWLRKDLENYEKNLKQQYPWLIVFAHKPMYCSNAWSYCTSPEPLWIRETMEHLLHKHKVDLFITGHTHSYERSWPVYKKEIQQTYRNYDRTIHLVVGNAGAQEDLDWDWQPQPSWSAERFSKYGYGRMTIFNSTHLLWEMVGRDGGKEDPVDSKPTLDDRIWITKV